MIEDSNSSTGSVKIEEFDYCQMKGVLILNTKLVLSFRRIFGKYPLRKIEPYRGGA